MNKGRITLPSENNFLKETMEIMDRWGADAIRDSDGTKLPQEIKDLDSKIYTTYFVARQHNAFAKEHMNECQQIYLSSRFKLAKSNELEIDCLEGYFEEQIKVDYDHNPKIWWEVMDRTMECVVDPLDWDCDAINNKVYIHNARAYHEYSVSFLAYIIWDPTQMYNHITNDWKDKEHEIPFDVRKKHSNQFVKDYLKNWLQDNPDCDVVRFTTFFYHFTLIFNDMKKEKFVDWFGYGASVSTEAILAFDDEYGYRLSPEVFVDKGYYNSSFRVPSKEYRDFINFQQRFVKDEAKCLVDLVHQAGKEAVMFLGDNWIGTEPYGPYFKEIGLDAVVGSIGGGTTLRMISEIPHIKYSEGRFLPYFFPDTFYEGNDPCIEAIANWLTARRAMMRKPLDRIGYGGYLSLAYKFPKFIDYIESVCDEFRLIYDNIHGVKPYCGLKVAILNSWGVLRSWQTHMVAHALEYKQTYSYLGILESLSGMNVEVCFISFEDILHKGIDQDIDVIINAGDHDSSFSGGSYWNNPKLVSIVRQWVDHGKGFVGIGEPSSFIKGGRSFQLADVLGIDKEVGFSLSSDKYFTKAVTNHFISEDVIETIDFGEGMKNIYSLYPDTEIITYENNEILLSSHDYGKGRSVYIAGLPYSEQNSRILQRSLYYVAHKEKMLKKWYADNLYCEVHAYPEANKYAILNNSNTIQISKVYDGEGTATTVELKPCEIRWMVMKDE